MRPFRKHIKNGLITVVSLAFAFGVSLLFQYIFQEQEHITTVFVFAVFLISLSRWPWRRIPRTSC